MPATSQRLIAAMLCVILVAMYATSARPTLAADPIFVGAGDIADCSVTSAESSGAEQTAKLLDGITGEVSVFTLGDNAYPSGTSAEFSGCYNPTWGRHKARTRPVPGNHDYDTSNGGPYYSYFGASAGEPGKGYYSYNVGAWHIVALNSEIDAGATSLQAQWLRADLAANPATCTLAYWHKSLYSSGQHGNLPLTQELWKILHQAGADVVLSGHDHNYERFRPQDPYGRDDPNGIRQFVVGTGGADQRGMALLRPNSEIFNSSSHGVLKLTLHATSYDWQFVPVAGKTFTDSGTANCFAGANPTATPTNTATPLPQGQANVSFTPVADAYVDKATPTTAYATNSQLQGVVSSTTEKQSFLRFSVSGLPTGAAIVAAKLQLYVVNGSAKSGGIFNTTSNIAWAESITWNTKPGIDGPQLASIGPVTAGNLVTIDVSSVIAGNGAYSFAISSPKDNGDTFGYASRESSIADNRPQLIITAQTGPLPSATPTLTATNTPTPSDTPTATNTPTATDTPTATPTVLAASTATPTNTSTPTSTPTATPTIANLLANGGFELDTNNDSRPDSWTSNARFTRSATVVRSGSFAGKLAATDNSGFTIVQQVNSLVAGQVYSFAGAVNIPATTDAFTCKFEIRWRNAAGSTLRTDALKTYSAATGGAWDLVNALLLPAPANTNNAQVRMVLTSLKATIYVDDFAFQADVAPADTTPPLVTAQAPAPGAADVATGTIVRATFDEAVAGVSSTTFTLTDPGGATVPASISYDAASRAATLTPSSALAAGTTYTAHLTGGIADTAGNSLAPVNWSFSTAPAGSGGTTFTFGSAADTYVSQAAPTSSFATSSSISIVGGTSTEKQAFIRFMVSGLPAGAVVQSAKLRLFVTNDSTGGGSFYSISDTTWPENISWTSTNTTSAKPSIDGPLYATLGAVMPNTFVDVDLTGAIVGNGSYSFAITLPSSNGNTVGYASREASTVANRPQLSITFQ